MTQEEQIQFVLDITARAARTIIQHIRDDELDFGAVDKEGLRQLVIARIRKA